MKQFSTEVKWSLIFIAMMLGWMVLEKLAGLHAEHIDKHHIYTNFVAIPAIAIYVLAFRDKKTRDYGGSMTYKQAFGTGLVMTVIIAAVSPLTQWITSTIITPEYFPNVISYSVKQGHYTQAEAEAFFNVSNYMVQAAIGALVMGLLTTAIVGLFVRTKQ